MTNDTSPRRLPRSTINGTRYYRDGRRHELRNVDDPSKTIPFESLGDYCEFLYWTLRQQPLVGQRLVSAQLEPADFGRDRTDWSPVLTFADGTRLELMSDEEGNGPGRFEVVLPSGERHEVTLPECTS